MTVDYTSNPSSPAMTPGLIPPGFGDQAKDVPIGSDDDLATPVGSQRDENVEAEEVVEEEETVVLLEPKEGLDDDEVSTQEVLDLCKYIATERSALISDKMKTQIALRSAKTKGDKVGALVRAADAKLDHTSYVFELTKKMFAEEKAK